MMASSDSLNSQVVDPVSTPDTSGQISLQRLIFSLTEVSQNLAQTQDLDVAINRTLAQIGQNLQVDRAYLFEQHTDPAISSVPATSQRWEWVGPGITPQINNPYLQDIRAADLSLSWYKTLANHQPILGHTEQFTAYEQQRLIAQNVRAVLIIPIVIQGKFWGFIGVDDCQSPRQWSDVEIEILKSIGAQVGNAIAAHTTETTIAQIVAERTQLLTKNKQQFRSCVENNDDIVSSWLPDSRITYLSPNFASITGFRVDEYIGQSFAPLVHPDDVHIWAAANAQALSSKSGVTGIQLRCLNADGSSIWMSLNVCPALDSAGQVKNFQGILHNIDGQKALERKLREQVQLSNCRAQISTVLTSSDRLQTILQQCTEILVEYLDAAFARIWTTDNTATMLELQASAGMYTHIDGAHARVPVGQFKIGLIAEEKQPHLTNDVLNDPRVGDKAWAKREGMVAFAGHPLIADDRVIGVIALFAKHPLNDSVIQLLDGIAGIISLGIQRHQAEAALLDERTMLQTTLSNLQTTQSHLIQSEKMSSLGEMVAGVAHEINNPVNFIHGNINHVKNYSHDLIELLQAYQSEHSQPSDDLQALIAEIDLPFLLEDFPKVLDSMKSGTQRIREIVLTLRNFSRLDEADMKDVNIHDGIDSTLLMLQNKLKSKSDRPTIKVVKHYADLPKIYCYAGQLNQVFMNILANAIDALDDYCDAAWPQLAAQQYQPSLTITTEITNHKTVKIHLRDNGPGIPEEAQSRLFDPFFTTKPVGKGTGLGLSISYQIIVEKHAGNLTCESRVGQGSSFTIELPIIEPPLDGV